MVITLPPPLSSQSRYVATSSTSLKEPPFWEDLADGYAQTSGGARYLAFDEIEKYFRSRLEKEATTLWILKGQCRGIANKDFFNGRNRGGGGEKLSC